MAKQAEGYSRTHYQVYDFTQLYYWESENRDWDGWWGFYECAVRRDCFWFQKKCDNRYD